ncbi:hypothetical protein IMZ31_19360 (plasmid) [Pontibacillus sp. ALD_SL1]|uniref:hypothetical protein n=1 Tax=Pontibacillus sp. ALD_SL1 TaxID=2777185 RepID=UPI001A95B5F6|nr:hypothetical protein [Pontibacillus sp. ALD_SL1]QST02709.1 hypothetical protein IMZ31_19360 [Pontibacillus sp. ALD_SL1]
MLLNPLESYKEMTILFDIERLRIGDLLLLKNKKTGELRKGTLSFLSRTLLSILFLRERKEDYGRDSNRDEWDIEPASGEEWEWHLVADDLTLSPVHDLVIHEPYFSLPKGSLLLVEGEHGEQPIFLNNVCEEDVRITILHKNGSMEEQVIPIAEALEWNGNVITEGGGNA